jgi:hypothetical protein
VPKKRVVQWDASLVAAVRGLIVRPDEGIIRMFKFGDVARHGQSLFNHSAVPFRGGISVLELRLDGELCCSHAAD